MSRTATRRIAAAAASLAVIGGLALAPASMAKHDYGHGLGTAGYGVQAPAATPTGSASIGGRSYSVSGGTWSVVPFQGGLQVNTTLNTNGGQAVVQFNVTLPDGNKQVTVKNGSTIRFQNVTYSVAPNGKIALSALAPPNQHVVTPAALATDHGAVSFDLWVN